MSLQNIPNMSTRIEEYAAWLILEAGTRKEMKKRLGNELVHLCTEIDEEEEKAFLIECEKCELPLIVHHNLDGSSCAFMNFFEAATETAMDTIMHSVTNLNGALLATQQGKENFSAAFMEEIEKLPEYEQVKRYKAHCKTLVGCNLSIFHHLFGMTSDRQAGGVNPL